MTQLRKAVLSYLFLPFIGGFLIMLLEMCAFRVISTTFGASTYVTGTLLTLIMTALAGGYCIGGFLSTKASSIKYLFILLWICCIYLIVMDVLFGTSIPDELFKLSRVFQPTSPLRLIVPPALTAGLLYGIPMLLLAQISPFVIQFSTVTTQQSLSKPGSASGVVMAVSTIGSIIGTLVTSFVLLPFLGINATLKFSVAILLGILCISYLWLKIKRTFLDVLAISAILFIWMYSLLVTTSPEANLIYSSETPYGNIKLYVRERPDGEKYFVYKPSKLYLHSIFYPTTPLRSQLSLASWIPAITFRPHNYLILGSAGGSAIRQIQEFDPTAHITAVEIDEKVTEMSKTYFGIFPSEKLKLVTSDAKAFLGDTDQTFDFIIVDLFSGEFIPTHCLTDGFFSLVLSHLTSRGILSLNTNMVSFPYFDPRYLKVFSPLYHLESTLFKAGFQTLYENTSFHTLYAFRNPTPEARFTSSLRVALGKPFHDSIKTSIATTLLKTLPVPPTRAAWAPYTNDWTPEHLIQLKSNYANFETALFKQMSDPQWNYQDMSSTHSNLGASSANQRFELWKQNRPLNDYSLGEVADCNDYFYQVSDLIRKDHPILPVLAQFFLLGCDFSNKDLLHASQEERLTYAYNEGLRYAHQDDYRHSLPLLSFVLNHLHN